jgi:tRNA nucleotidyltransferase (CCA-adding enzyme)
MTETGWGQVPVANPETGDIVGIVTRTDLLKTLAPEPHLPGRLNLGERLEASIPEIHLALLKSVASVAFGLHLPVYVVGGFVRDLILERPGLDFDIVVEGDAIALARALVQHYGGRLTSHGRFGTAKWFLREANIEYSPQKAVPVASDQLTTSRDGRLVTPEFLDLISARTEFYTHPTALPTVERSSIKLDLHRRDFTINTLALRLDGHHYGELYDYWGGLDDLRKGRIRVLHSISFVDDPTRMLRAVRFEQRFKFQIEERTLQLLREALPLLNRVSGDRIRHELDHMIDEEDPACMMARLDDLGLLAAIHPDLAWDEWIHEKISNLRLDPRPPPEWKLPGRGGRHSFWRFMVYSLWLVRLAPESARGVMGRLKLAAATANDILKSCILRQDLARLVLFSTNEPSPASSPGQAWDSPSAMSARLDGLSPLTIYTVYLAVDDPRIKDLLYTYITRWRHLRTFLTGDDLRARGVPPGPIYARILTALRNAWLDGKVSTAAQEAEYCAQLLTEASAGHGNDVSSHPETAP